MLDRIGGGMKDYAPVILRVGLCTLFLASGARALLDLGRSSGAWEITAAVVQILGAVFCLIGFLTRWAAAGLAVLVLLRIVQGPKVDAFINPYHQLLGAALFLSLALYCTGGGKWSLDLSQKKKDEK